MLFVQKRLLALHVRVKLVSPVTDSNVQVPHQIVNNRCVESQLLCEPHYNMTFVLDINFSRRFLKIAVYNKHVIKKQVLMLSVPEVTHLHCLCVLLNVLNSLSLFYSMTFKLCIIRFLSFLSLLLALYHHSVCLFMLACLSLALIKDLHID